MKTLTVDVPWNYSDAGTPAVNAVAFSTNATTSLKPSKRSRVRLPNNLATRTLKLKNFAYALLTSGGFEDPTGVIGYFKVDLSFGSRKVSSSYVITHPYTNSTNPPEGSTILEESIALPFSSTNTEFNGCWSVIELPSTAETEMFVDISVPEQSGTVDYGFKYLTLWFDVL